MKPVYLISADETLAISLSGGPEFQIVNNGDVISVCVGGHQIASFSKDEEVKAKEWMLDLLYYMVQAKDIALYRANL